MPIVAADPKQSSGAALTTGIFIDRDRDDLGARDNVMQAQTSMDNIMTADDGKPLAGSPTRLPVTAPLYGTARLRHGSADESGTQTAA
jgi:hypothetical protein